MKARDFRAGIAFFAVLLVHGCGGGAPSTPPPASSGPVASAPTAASAGSTWAVPAMVSNDVYTAMFVDAQLSADGIGNMFLAAPWVSTTQAVVAEYQKPVGMNWGAPLALSPLKATTQAYLNGYADPQLRSDSAGNAVAAWVDFNNSAPSDRNWISNVYVRNFSAATGWGAPMLMHFSATAYATRVNLTAQADGTAWVVWLERTYMDPTFSLNDRYAFFAAKYMPATGWSPAERVTADYGNGNLNILGSNLYFDSTSVFARVVTDGAGNPTVLFTPDTRSLYSTIKAAGIWSAPTLVAPAVTVPGTVNTIYNFDIAEDTHGNAIAVWQALDPTGTIKVVYSNRYVAGTGWGGVVAMPGNTTQHSFNPKLAMDNLGNAVLLWSEFDPRSMPAMGIWTARFDHAAGWQTPAIISSPPVALGEDSTYPQVAFDARGNAVAIWQKYNATVNRTLVMGCRYTYNVGWNTDQIISNGNGVVTSPRLAVSANGRATAAWAQDDIGNQSFKLWSNDFAP